MVAKLVFSLVVASNNVVFGNAATALLLIDVQDCFLEAETTSGKQGSLSVPASQIIPKINQIRAEKECLFDVVVRSQDYHPANHISFGSTHGLDPFSHLAGKGPLPVMCVNASSGKTADASCCPTQYVDSSKVDCDTKLCPPAPWTWASDNAAFIANNPSCTQCASDPASCFEDVQAMWTDHCLSTAGGDATFPPNLTKKDSDIIVKKGENQYVDAYSAFMDNSQNLMTELDSTLQSHNVDTLYVAGIATDVCVQWTVRDALSKRTGAYKVHVIGDASAGLPVGTTPTQLHEDSLVWMKKEGASIINTADILAMSCPVTTAPVTTAPVTTTADGVASGATHVAVIRQIMTSIVVLVLFTS